MNRYLLYCLTPLEMFAPNDSATIRIFHYLTILSFLTGLTLIFLPGLNVIGETTESPISPTNKTVDEIVVTATKTKRDIKDLSGNASVISSKEITESNATTSDRILSNQPGIDIEGGKFLGSKSRLNIRGLQGNYGAQRVLVLVDGRPVNEEYMGDVDFRTIPIDNVDRIEIVRGPTSALYGSNAMGGVINFITKRVQDNKPFVEIKNSVGDFNTYGTSIQHGAKFSKMDYFISANDETTDGYLKNSDGTPRDWQTQNVNNRVNLSLDKDSTLGLSMGWNNGNGHEESFIRELSRDYYDLIYQTNWSQDKKTDFSARIYRNGLAQTLKWDYGFNGKYNQSTIGSQVQQSAELIKGHLFTFGIDNKTEDVLVKEAAGKIDEVINSSALYIQDEMIWQEKLILTIGLRNDNNDQFGNELSPRAGVVYHLSDQASLRGAIGKAYRAPTVSDLYLPKTSYFGMTFEGNPNLGPETIWSVETGLDYKFTEELMSRLTIYKSALRDAWDYMRDQDNVFRPRNVTKISITGLEAEMNYEMLKGLSAFANYTANTSKYDESKTNPSIQGNYVENVPLAQGIFGVRLQPESDMTINLKVKGSGIRYTDPDNTGANKLPKYMVADVDLNTRMTKNGTIFLSVNNLFNRDYKEVKDYAQPGRYFTAGFSLRY
ncbi:MAG: TonB-dependent receptor [Planctomycetota bacterium]